MRIPDTKNLNGRWVQAAMYQGRSTSTLSKDRWHQIKARTTEGSAYQKNQPTYIGCQNRFKNFHHFVDWSRGEYGYNLRDTGDRLWSLEKDLLCSLQSVSPVYSEETCMFVPSSVNLFFSSCKNKVNTEHLPFGVIFRKGKITSLVYDLRNGLPVSRNAIQVYKGDCLFEAHHAFKTKKLELMMQMRDYALNIGHGKLSNAIDGMVCRWTQLVASGDIVKNMLGDLDEQIY